LKLANPLEILNEAKKISEKAVEMFPNSGKSYFWLGTLIGQIGQEKGVISSLFSIKPMRDYLEKAIELEPHYAPTYDILSKLYMQAPRRPISIGNKNTALKYRLKSVELDYENNEYRWNLYEIYIDLKKFSEASEQLNIIIENTKYSIDEKDLLIYEKAIKKLNK
jgi:tetratricopeptide (TPR) repeat protein